jgi:hypothetical protein
VRKIRRILRSALHPPLRRRVEERRHDVCLVLPAEARTVPLEPGNTARPIPVPGANAPMKSRIPWILLGVTLLGVLLARACADGLKGGMQTVNIPFLLAAIVAIGAVSLHVYTMEVWIWPKLNVEGFPATPFGDAYVTMGFYRIVWHFFTVSWVGTIILMLFFAFGDVIPYVDTIVHILIRYWIAIVIEIFVVAALSLEPGQSYIKTMIKAFQWVIVLVMVAFMYWGLKI